VFEICLLGVYNLARTNVGWGYEETSVAGTGGQYGYSCLSNIELPDLCENGVMESCAAHQAQTQHLDTPQAGDVIKLMNMKHLKKLGESAVFTRWMSVAVLVIFALNVFICFCMKCVRRNKKAAAKQYGKIDNDESEDDSDDVTDSETDFE
jgi:hypothetical protein